MPRARGIDERGGGAVSSLRAEGGDLLLFRGDVLHAVESNGWARGGAGREARDVDMQTVRLSVAFNEDSLANDKKVAERRGEVGK